jgi:hypothetical protein
MTKKQIAFLNADEYVLVEPYTDVAPFKPPTLIKTEYGRFRENGEYVIHKGFMFSASGPTLDTESTHRGACVHDFFYSLMKDGYLSKDYRDDADYLLYDMLREDGMSDFRAWYWLRGVRAFGGFALDSEKPKVMYAPSFGEQPYYQDIKFGRL